MRLEGPTLTRIAAWFAVGFALQAAGAARAEQQGKFDPPSAAMPSPRQYSAWHDQHRRLTQLPGRKAAEVIFVGDSITEQWSTVGKLAWKNLSVRRRVLNLGIGGDRTQHVLWRILHGGVDGMTPQLAVVLIGTNNLKERRNTVEHTVEGVIRVVETLAERLPDTDILLLGILPAGRTPKGERRNDVRAANASLQRHCWQQQIVFLDVSEEFVNGDGAIDPTLMPDYLHLSAKGYERLAAALEPTLAAASAASPTPAR